jgi:1D-myo-inositol-tetrakisphosphate 5-kinase/inositol-polyphosphate multikinase
MPKSYGKSLKPADLSDGIASFFPLASQTDISSGLTPTSGLPHHLLLPVLHAIRDDVASIRDAFQKVHLRMVGGSILIAYEADWETAEEGLKLLEERNPVTAAYQGGEGCDSDVARDDEDDDDDDDDDADEDEDEDEDEETDRPFSPWIVKLIDFAHTRLKPGHGPDEGVLLGLNTILKLLNGRIEQIQNPAT